MSEEKEGFGKLTNETIMHGLECKARMSYIITGEMRYLTLANVICMARLLTSMF